MSLISNKTKNITKLLLIVASFILPLIVAHYLFYYGNMSGAKTNHGNLIASPHSISELNLNKPKLINTDAWRNRAWHILYRIPKVCDTECLDILYKLQQVHIALGKHKDRVQRVNIHNLTSNYDMSSILTLYDSYPHMTMVSTTVLDDTSDNNWLSSQNIYIADPLGNIILSYNLKNENFAKQILKDTEKLLKNSQIG